MSKSVLIAEPNQYLAEVLKSLLSIKGLEVVGTTTAESEVIDSVQQLEPDLLIIDYEMTKMDVSRYSDIEKIKDALPQLKILVLGFHDGIDGFDELFRHNGFDGFCSKFEDLDCVLESVNAILA